MQRQQQWLCASTKIQCTSIINKDTVYKYNNTVYNTVYKYNNTVYNTVFYFDDNFDNATRNSNDNSSSNREFDTKNDSSSKNNSNFPLSNDHINCIEYKYANNLSENNKTDDNGCVGALMSNNVDYLVICNMTLTDTKRDDCLGSLCNNDADNIRCTNNTSLHGIGNNGKHNDINNDNNIDYNPSYNNDSCLVIYDTKCITKANIDNSTEANSSNE